MSETTRASVRLGLVAKLAPTVVDELLAAYDEAKSSYYLGGYRLSAVEGGRFTEAALRLLQEETTGTFVPIGQTLDSEAVIRGLSNLPIGSHPESIRLHIPRALRVVYDIRNKRDAAHLGDGIDPNLQDATLVASILDWVMAELVRIHHSANAAQAHAMVRDLVTRRAPVLQEFDGFLKVLDVSLAARERCLVLLYHRGTAGASFLELKKWAKPAMRKNLRRTLTSMVHDKAWVHEATGTYFITEAGLGEVHQRHLV